MARMSEAKERKTDSPSSDAIRLRFPEPNVFFMAISLARRTAFAVDRFI